MIAFLQYLVAWMLALAALAQSRSPFDPGGSLMVLAIFGGTAAVAGRLVADAVRRAGDDRQRLVWVALAANLGRIAALATSWKLLSDHGLARLPSVLGIEDWRLVPQLVLLLPFLLLAATARAALHGAEVAAETAPASLRRSLLLDARMALLPFAPVVLVAVVADVEMHPDRDTWWGRAWIDLAQVPTLRVLLLLGVSFAGLLVLPAVLRRIWGCRPLPAGPLRDRLEAYARRVGFRAVDLLLWPTGGLHVNAAVVGLLPRFRYVFLTDALVETLSPDEVEAVFAHEAGHARRGHLLLFLGYTAVLALAAFLPGGGLGAAGDLLARIPLPVRIVGVVVLWYGVVLGWVSRRFEQEADVFGIDTVPAPPGDDGAPARPEDHPFARALERIAAQAAGIREVTGWRHFSIADRVDFVRRYLTDESVRRTYRRHIRLLRGCLVAAVAGTLACAAFRIPHDLRELPARAMLDELAGALAAKEPRLRAERLARAADAARDAGRGDVALRWYAEAVRLGEDPGVLRDWAESLEASGRPLGARAAREAPTTGEDAP